MFNGHHQELLIDYISRRHSDIFFAAGYLKITIYSFRIYDI